MQLDTLYLEGFMGTSGIIRFRVAYISANSVYANFNLCSLVTLFKQDIGPFWVGFRIQISCTLSVKFGLLYFSSIKRIN